VITKLVKERQFLSLNLIFFFKEKNHYFFKINKIKHALTNFY